MTNGQAPGLTLAPRHLQRIVTGASAAVLNTELHTEWQCPGGQGCQAGGGLLTGPWGLTLPDFTHHPMSGSQPTSLRGLQGKPRSSLHPIPTTAENK